MRLPGCFICVVGSTCSELVKMLADVRSSLKCFMVVLLVLPCLSSLSNHSCCLSRPHCVRMSMFAFMKIICLGLLVVSSRFACYVSLFAAFLRSRRSTFRPPKFASFCLLRLPRFSFSRRFRTCFFGGLQTAKARTSFAFYNQLLDWSMCSPYLKR